MHLRRLITSTPAASGGGPTVLFADDFEGGSDGDPINEAWEVINGAPVLSGGGVAYPSMFPADGTVFVQDAGVSEYSIKALMRSASLVRESALVVRFGDTNNYWRLFLDQSQMWIYETAGGSNNVRATAAYTPQYYKYHAIEALVTPTKLSYRVDINNYDTPGDYVTGAENWTPWLEYESASLASNTKAGVWLDSDAACDIADIEVTG